MPHDWVKYESKEGLVSWNCGVCNFLWVQSRKPHPHYKLWYNYGFLNRKLMTCDEWVLDQVHQS
jgi:hypothetical protein